MAPRKKQRSPHGGRAEMRQPQTIVPPRLAQSTFRPDALIGALLGVSGTLFILQGAWTPDRLIVAQHIGQIIGGAVIGGLIGFIVGRARG